MKQFQSLNPRRLVFFAVLLVILSGALFYWMRELVRELIVLPLSYLIYLGGIFIDTTPQVFFWFAVVIILLLFAYRGLNRRRKMEDLARQSIPAIDRQTATNGRMSFWAAKVNILRHNRASYFMGGFHQSLGRLLIDLLTHRYRLTQSQVEDRVRAGLLDLPTEVQEYLLYSLSRPEINTGRIRRFWQEFLTIIRQWLRWPVLQQKKGSPVDLTFQRIDRVIHYMEEELEVSHEHPSQSSR